MARMVQCVKLGREAEGLDFPPMPGELGKRVFENISKEAWAGWIRLQTMIINENRLNLADALDTYRRGIEKAEAKGDIQAAKEMHVFARRIEKQLAGEIGRASCRERV